MLNRLRIHSTPDDETDFDEVETVRSTAAGCTINAAA